MNPTGPDSKYQSDGAEDAPLWRVDFPITSAGEDEVTRREFVRYLVVASGGFAAGSVGVALWSSLRSINTGEPRPIVALEQVPEGTAHLFRYPTDSDPTSRTATASSGQLPVPAMSDTNDSDPSTHREA